MLLNGSIQQLNYLHFKENVHIYEEIYHNNNVLFVNCVFSCKCHQHFVGDDFDFACFALTKASLVKLYLKS